MTKSLIIQIDIMRYSNNNINILITGLKKIKILNTLYK